MDDLGVPLFLETPILNNDRNCWLSAFWDQLQLSKNLHHKILIKNRAPSRTLFNQKNETFVRKIPATANALES